MASRTARRHAPRRLRINISPAERIGRIAVGLAAVVAALVLLTSAGSVLAVVLEVLLALAGLDLVITGALPPVRQVRPRSQVSLEPAMSSHDPDRDTPKPDEPADHGHGGHGWMMIACCVPMIIIAVVLLATGVIGVGWILVVFACLAMMALMMRGMGHGGDSGDGP